MWFVRTSSLCTSPPPPPYQSSVCVAPLHLTLSSLLALPSIPLSECVRGPAAERAVPYRQPGPYRHRTHHPQHRLPGVVMTESVDVDVDAYNRV